MSARVGFTADDAERQAGEAAAYYLNRALQMAAGRLNLEKSLERDPAAFAVQFAPLLSALIEAQAREYQSWVAFDRLGALAGTMRDSVEDLANVLDRRLGGLDDALSLGLGTIAALPDSKATP